MNPLYYAVNKKGYQLRPVPQQLKADFNKQLPVFRVVSEFMNPKEKQQEVEPINQVEEEIDNTENIFSSRSLNIGKQSKTKYVLLNTGRMMEKQEVSSIDLDSSANEKIKQKQMSVQDTNASRMRTTIKGNHIKINSANLRNEKTNQRKDMNDKELLYLELQKEQALRRNLQNSYKNLLEKLKNEGIESAEAHYQVSPLKRKFLSPTNKKVQNSGQTDQNGTNTQSKFASKAKLRKSCCQLSSDQGQIQLKCQPRSFQDDEDPENLQNEQQFRTKLCKQIELCQERIDDIQNRILKRQKQLQKEAKYLLNLEQENRLLRLNEQNLRLKQKNLNSLQENNKNELSIRQHIHYMFTILIMFFIIAMIAKKHN